MIEGLINNQNLILFNDTKPTYIAPNSTTSCLDLFIGSQELGTEYAWDVLDHTYGSDHYPTILTHLIHKNRGEERPRRWVMKRAREAEFKTLCYERLNNSILDMNNPMEVFTHTLRDIATETIPKSSAYPKRTPVPWFDDECKASIQAKKQAQRQYQRYRTEELKIARNKQEALTQRLLRQKQRESWRS